MQLMQQAATPKPEITLWFPLGLGFSIVVTPCPLRQRRAMTGTLRCGLMCTSKKS